MFQIYEIKNESRFKQYLTQIFVYIIFNAKLSRRESEQLILQTHTLDLSPYEQYKLKRLLRSYIKVSAIDKGQAQNLFVKLQKSHDQAMKVFYYGTQAPKFQLQLYLPIVQKVSNKKRNNTDYYQEEGTYFLDQKTDSNTKDKIPLNSRSKMSYICNFIGKYMFSNYMKVGEQEPQKDSEKKRQYFFKIKKQ